MAWAHKWADHLDTGFYYNLLNRGILKPSDIEPDVEPFMHYIDAFKELSSCRSGAGMGLGPIPFTAIVEYSRLFEIGEDFEDFHYIIRRMDNELLRLESQKSPKKQETNVGKKA